jgi:hypothetical protein
VRRSPCVLAQRQETPRPGATGDRRSRPAGEAPAWPLELCEQTLVVRSTGRDGPALDRTDSQPHQGVVGHGRSRLPAEAPGRLLELSEQTLVVRSTGRDGPTLDTTDSQPHQGVVGQGRSRLPGEAPGRSPRSVPARGLARMCCLLPVDPTSTIADSITALWRLPRGPWPTVAHGPWARRAASAAHGPPSFEGGSGAVGLARAQFSGLGLVIETRGQGGPSQATTDSQLFLQLPVISRNFRGPVWPRRGPAVDRRHPWIRRSASGPLTRARPSLPLVRGVGVGGTEGSLGHAGS